MTIKETVLGKVMERIDFTKDVEENEIIEAIDVVIASTPERKLLSVDARKQLRREVYNAIRKLDVLEEFLENEAITEIMINGYDTIFVEENGRVYKTDKSFLSKEKLEDVIQQIVAGCNRTVNEANPIADARLSSGERVNIVLAPVALNGPIVTIRRFPKNPITMERLIQYKSITEEAAQFLERLVISKYNIFISGGTGSGKTTFLNALSGFIPKEERIITIEDSAELQLIGATNIVKLETRTKSSEGCSPITIRDLIRSALRMRPERVIVGEVRGEEALDMLQAMNTGHDGSLSTGHANSTVDMLKRLETMVLMGTEMPLAAIRGQIASGVDIIVHLSRMPDGSRKVVEISEVVKMNGTDIEINRLFSFEDGSLCKKADLINTGKLERMFGKER